MPTTRILNCSTSLENCYLCIGESVAGFSNRGHINSHKLRSDTAAEFSAYVVKLVQKIDLLEEGAEFALTVEEV